jgi:ribonucleoside-diphosphate reductase alpha chain
VTLAQSFGTENNPAHQERTAASPAPAPLAAAPSPAPVPGKGAANGSSARSGGPHSTAELIEFQQGRTADAPLCLTCGTKMRPAGSCYVCEGCGSTSGCSLLGVAEG